MFTSPTSSSASSAPHTNPHPNDYANLLAILGNRIAAIGSRHVFTTNVLRPFGDFLAWLPEDVRQHHRCDACRRFIDTYGGLAYVGDAGEIVPLLWAQEEPTLGVYRHAAEYLYRLVHRSAVTGVFLSSEKVWGTPLTTVSSRNTRHLPGTVFRHMGGPSSAVYAHPTLSASQRIALFAEEYRMLCASLDEYRMEHVQKAHAWLSNGALFRSEKAAGVAAWLYLLYSARETRKGARGHNYTWLMVASAPVGFCHVKSSMIGTLLDDIKAGKDFEAIKRAWAAKMDPMFYQRPQAPPKPGNIDQAEKLVEKLGIARSLERRFARLGDLHVTWRRPMAAPPAGTVTGVFAALRQSVQPAPAQSGLNVTMTWTKFAREVLPNAENILFRVPHMGQFTAFVTAVHADAPPVLQWDREDRRNPVSTYTYIHGSAAAQWNLNPALNPWCEVDAITLNPAHWYDNPAPNQPSGVFLVLRGAYDTRYVKGAAFFPETLKSTLHEVRATLDAHAQQAVLTGAKDAACGYAFIGGKPWQGFVIRVTSRGVVTDYTIDRWD